MKIKWWVIALVASLLYCASIVVFGAEVYSTIGEDNGKMVKVKFTKLKDPCVNAAAIEFIKARTMAVEAFLKGEVLWDGEVFEACWVEMYGAIYFVPSDKVPLGPLNPANFQEEGV